MIRYSLIDQSQFTQLLYQKLKDSESYKAATYADSRGIPTIKHQGSESNCFQPIN